MIISNHEAFRAMVVFLEGYWLRNGKPDEIGSLLGSLMLLEDGKPADAAMWADWNRAIEFVKNPTSR